MIDNRMTLDFAEIAESCNNCMIVACDYAPKKSIDSLPIFSRCDSVESPIGAIIAQQSCNYLKDLQRLRNSRETESSEIVSGISLFIYSLAELHDSCKPITPQFCNCCTTIAFG